MDINFILDPPRFSPKYFRHKIYDLDLYQMLDSRSDCISLSHEDPCLISSLKKEKENITGKIKRSYDNYTETISSDIMAASLEASVLLMALCNCSHPRSILDLGSGFSSFVFRSYCKNSDVQPAITSVDDDDEWLKKTKDFLSLNNVHIQQLLPWKDFINNKPSSFDLIFYDIGGFPFRIQWLEYILTNYGKKGSTVVIDDMHHAGYGLYVKDLLKKKGIRSYNIRNLALDSFGRYPLLITL